MKKKVLAMISMTVVASMLLAGCSNGGSDSSSTDDAAATEEAAAEEESGSSGAETDIKVSSEEIAAAAEESLGDWEAEYAAEYDVTGDGEYTWAFIDMGFEDTFTTKIRNTFTEYVGINYPNVTVVEGDGEMDANIQIQLAENYIAQGVDCICLIPADADGCVGLVDTCLAEKMPLVVINSVIHHDEFQKTVGYSGSSNYEAGKLQAEWMIENVDDTETVVMCYQKGADGYDHTAQRYNGLFETLDAAGYNYELKSELVSEYMRDIALQNAEDWITSFGDEIDVVACCNDESAMGTLQAYQAAGLADDLIILGIDANQDALQEVEKGTIAMTVFQNAMGQAKWGAIAAYDACERADGTTIGFDIPFETVDKNNVADYLS